MKLSLSAFVVLGFICASLETLKVGMVINPMWMKTSRLGEVSSAEEVLLAKLKLGFESK